MLFPSEIFLFLFLPFTISIYYVFLRKTRTVKNLFLLLVSLLFYAWGGTNYVWLMIAVILCNYLFGLLVHRFRTRPRVAKIILMVTVVVDIGILAYYKYTDFIIENMNKLFDTQITYANIALPLGISFFLFQALSYVIDIYRGQGRVQKNPLNVGLYVAFFPQLIAGPIVRYDTVAKQIQSRRETFKQFSDGVTLFIIGLGKKVMIANNIGAVVDTAFAVVGDGVYQASFLMAWLGAITYTLPVLKGKNNSH